MQNVAETSAVNGNAAVNGDHGPGDKSKGMITVKEHKQTLLK